MHNSNNNNNNNNNNGLLQVFLSDLKGASHKVQMIHAKAPFSFSDSPPPWKWPILCRVGRD